MKKEIGGKTYVQVPAQVDGSCIGCAAQHDGGLCEKLHTGENGMFTPNICVLVDKIFKEQTMNDQKEKTALELVDELIAMMGCPPPGQLIKLKSAIERERDASEITIDGLEELVKSHTQTIHEMNDRLKSAITMRPISELPGKVPDGCAVFAFNDIGGCLFSKDANPQKISPLNGTTFTHFYVLPLPLPKTERRLHPCRMPGCGSNALDVQKDDDMDLYCIDCTKCGARGPMCGTIQDAKDAWGYAE